MDEPTATPPPGVPLATVAAGNAIVNAVTSIPRIASDQPQGLFVDVRSGADRNDFHRSLFVEDPKDDANPTDPQTSQTLKSFP